MFLTRAIPYLRKKNPPAAPSTPAAHLRVDLAPDLSAQAIKKSLLICGSAEAAMDLIPSETVQTVVTSPPYWSLRDYGANGQIGRADMLSDYTASLVRIFRKVRRTLRPDGTLWLNIGDSYTSGNRRYRAPDKKNQARAMLVRPTTPEGLKPKDLIGVPWRIAMALQEDGLVAALRDYLVQAERASRVRSRSAHEGPRDDFSLL